MVSLSVNVTLPLVPDVVVVDPNFQLYAPLVAAARAGRLNLHLRASGAEAIKLARRLNIDAWLVSPELDDMAGEDFVCLLAALPNRSSHAVAMVAPSDTSKGSVAAGHRLQVSLRHPISLDAVEAVLRSPAISTTATTADLTGSSTRRSGALLSLPIGVGAAMLAIAALMMG
jgi:DNA-binding response OmpR family regulator